MFGQFTRFQPITSFMRVKLLVLYKDGIKRHTASAVLINEISLVFFTGVVERWLVTFGRPVKFCSWLLANSTKSGNGIEGRS